MLSPTPLELGTQESLNDYNDTIINLANQIIHDAIQKNASDIHIETFELYCRIRFRLDSVLYEISQIPHNVAIRLITRLKVMAQLDISERRLPQDGRFQLNLTKQGVIDIRMSTCPTLHGEKVVLRLLNSHHVSLDIATLGMNPSQQTLFLQKINQPQGLILVAGPTGSGKTVTLYSALCELNTQEKNISTVEDPIEIQLDGINQVNINSKIGFGFSTALRTFLRQDPDVLMVGEIRDTETAKIAIQAAQTGHLVLSTVHANSAIETVTRLRSLGITPYDITQSTSLIIAQRLARKLCPLCKQVEKTAGHLLDKTDSSFVTVYQANGCQDCIQGYRDRIGIYELSPMTDDISKHIVSDTFLSDKFQQNNFSRLRDSGYEKVLQGITSLNEINRIIRAD